jgi:hypothetical protein
MLLILFASTQIAFLIDEKREIFTPLFRAPLRWAIVDWELPFLERLLQAHVVWDDQICIVSKRDDPVLQGLKPLFKAA